MDERLITEEILEEAELAFKSSFKPETRFEKKIVFSTHQHKHVSDVHDRLRVRREQPARVVKRSSTSIIAEALLCKQLGWDIGVKATTNVHHFDEIVDLIREISASYGRKFWVNVGPVTRTEIELLTPFVDGILGAIGSVNKDVHKRISPNISMTSYMAMFSDARKIQRGINLTLGVGEKLEDLEELFRFVETNNINRIAFYPFKLVKPSRYFKEPSSFYCARWIAETRIRFPKMLIVAGTTEKRLAETGLFLKAGANSITNLPMMRLFSSEQAKVIEEEARNAGRTFVGTLTDMNELNKVPALANETIIREKLEKYIMAMKNTTSG